MANDHAAPAGRRFELRDMDSEVKVSDYLSDSWEGHSRAAYIRARQQPDAPALPVPPNYNLVVAPEGTPEKSIAVHGEDGTPYVWQDPTNAPRGHEAISTEEYPEIYVIPYYVADADHPPSADSISGYYQARDKNLNVPLFRPGNQPGPTTPGMQEHITESFATIEAQFPGRFRFVRTQRPEEALISFASIPEADFGGFANYRTGGILLNERMFDSAVPPDALRKTVLHEIGHTLGLRHPQSMVHDSYDTSYEHASYYDSLMTYPEINGKATNALRGDIYPASLMPADLEALAALYPIRRDLTDGIAIAPAPNRDPHAMARVLTRGNGVDGFDDVLPPLRGITYQPEPDTDDNTLVMRGVAGQDFSIRQLPHGISVIKDGFQEPRRGTLLAGHMERIILSPASETVTVNGNVEIIGNDGERQAFVGGDDIIVSGRGNSIRMTAQEFRNTNVYLDVDSQLSYHISFASDMEMDEDGFPIESLFGANSDEAYLIPRMQQYDENVSLFVFQVVPRDTDQHYPHSTVILELQDSSPEVHAYVTRSLDEFNSPGINERRDAMRTPEPDGADEPQHGLSEGGKSSVPLRR